MIYDYRDLDTGEEADAPDAMTYSVVALDHEHAVRYVLMTDQGAVVLRHLPLRMARIIESVRHIVYPDTARLEREYASARKDPATMTEEEVAEFLKLDRELAMTDMSALGVIVEPRLASMDDYEDLYDKLTDTDRLRLTTAVRVLASPRDPATVDPTAEAIARSAGLTLITPEMLQNLTVSQASYHLGRITQEARAIERQAGIKRVRRWLSGPDSPETAKRPPARRGRSSRRSERSRRRMP